MGFIRGLQMPHGQSITTLPTAHHAGKGAGGYIAAADIVQRKNNEVSWIVICACWQL